MPAREIVARASAVLDRVAGGESKASLPWAWHPKLDAGGSPVEALQSAARAFLSSLGLPIGSALPPNHAGVDGGAGEDDVPVLPARAGAPASEACIPLRIANDDAAAASLAFVSTGLVAPTGDSLPLRSVTFAPPLLTVPGGGQAVVEIRVAIPEATRPGKYSGLVTSTGGDPVRAVVIVEVT